MRLDLPTFERPTMAISGTPVRTNCDGAAADMTKRASMRFILRSHDTENAWAEFYAFSRETRRPAGPGSARAYRVEGEE